MREEEEEEEAAPGLNKGETKETKTHPEKWQEVAKRKNRGKPPGIK